MFITGKKLFLNDDFVSKENNFLYINVKNSNINKNNMLVAMINEFNVDLLQKTDENFLLEVPEKFLNEKYIDITLLVKSGINILFQTNTIKIPIINKPALKYSNEDFMNKGENAFVKMQNQCDNIQNKYDNIQNQCDSIQNQCENIQSQYDSIINIFEENKNVFINDFDINYKNNNDILEIIDNKNIDIDNMTENINKKNIEYDNKIVFMESSIENIKNMLSKLDCDIFDFKESYDELKNDIHNIDLLHKNNINGLHETIINDKKELENDKELFIENFSVLFEKVSKISNIVNDHIKHNNFDIFYEKINDEIFNVSLEIESVKKNIDTIIDFQNDPEDEYIFEWSNESFYGISNVFVTFDGNRIKPYTFNKGNDYILGVVENMNDKKVILKNKGKAICYDDGTCRIGFRCHPEKDGICTYYSSGTYIVMSRISDNMVEIWMG